LKDFSFLDQALRITAIPHMDLGAIASISRRDFHERESFFFRAKAPCIEYACLLIENALLLRTNRAGRIYAGFEKLSFMLPVIDRYLRIADVSECVYVFGQADWKPPRHPNMRLINLSEDFRMAREWFLIVDSPDLSAALVAAEEDGLETAQLDERNFTAFKSSNRAIVAKLVAAAEGLIDWSLAA
jgi:DICT domain-containing protein